MGTLSPHYGEYINKRMYFRRNVAERLLYHLSHSPVVLLNGARQTGKSTLARQIAEQLSMPYITFDDATMLSSASADPQSFVMSLTPPVVLDEVQLVPEIFRAIKLRVDKSRKAGMFLLTGSANVLLLPRLAESLAGRMQILPLFPLSQDEIAGRSSDFISKCFHQDFSLANIEPGRDEMSLADRVTTGGYPEVVVQTSVRAQRDWINAYITTVLQRDVRQIAEVERLAMMPNLLSLIAARTGGLLNMSDLSTSSGIPHTSLSRYLALLEATFILHRLPPWFTTVGKRVTKTSKIYFVDTGLASSLMGVNSEKLKEDGKLFGFLFENFVLMELLKQASWSETPVALHHFRTHKGVEVDFVLENEAGQLVAIEVKLSGTVRGADRGGLNHFETIAKSKYKCGIVLYTGTRVYPLGTATWAVPIHLMWGAGTA
ncbi:MAG TPA: ATP-binding protein [Candidatus Obscuribacterales bacterium]